MYAVVTRVNIHNREAAESFLKEQIVPNVSQAPGFVAGYWTNIGGDKGMGMTVYESEEAARAVVDQGAPTPPSDVVEIESMEVAEVVANA